MDGWAERCLCRKLHTVSIRQCPEYWCLVEGNAAHLMQQLSNALKHGVVRQQVFRQVGRDPASVVGIGDGAVGIEQDHLESTGREEKGRFGERQAWGEVAIK